MAVSSEQQPRAILYLKGFVALSMAIGGALIVRWGTRHDAWFWVLAGGTFFAFGTAKLVDIIKLDTSDLKRVGKSVFEVVVLLVSLPLIVFAFGEPLWYGALTIYAWLLVGLKIVRLVFSPAGVVLAAIAILITIVWQSIRRRQRL